MTTCSSITSTAKANDGQVRWIVHVYIDDGRVYTYQVESSTKAREHAAAIIKTGYVHNDGIREFEHYGPHRIRKVKVTGGAVPTRYPDQSTGI